MKTTMKMKVWNSPPHGFRVSEARLKKKKKKKNVRNDLNQSWFNPLFCPVLFKRCVVREALFIYSFFFLHTRSVIGN